MCNDIRCLNLGLNFTRTHKTLLFIAALTVLFFLLPGHVYSEEVYLSWNPNQESDLADNLACFITAAQKPQATQPANPWHRIGRRLMMMPFLLLVAVVVGRKLKSLRPLKPAAKTIWGGD